VAVSRTVRGDDDMAPEGTPFRRIRMDDDLWERLDEAVKRADPDDNRSALIRRLARWYVGDIDEIPRRPEPRSPGRSA
jgi:Ribbon-helix-helix protein, copG family